MKKTTILLTLTLNLALIVVLAGCSLTTKKQADCGDKNHQWSGYICNKETKSCKETSIAGACQKPAELFDNIESCKQTCK